MSLTKLVESGQFRGDLFFRLNILFVEIPPLRLRKGDPAFTLENNYKVEIPIGARAQSLPGPGELPQSFETSEKLEARVEWNNLKQG